MMSSAFHIAPNIEPGRTRLHLAGEVPDEGDGRASVDSGTVLVVSEDGPAPLQLAGDFNLLDDLQTVIDGDGRHCDLQRRRDECSGVRCLLAGLPFSCRTCQGYIHRLARRAIKDTATRRHPEDCLRCTT